MYRNLSMGGLTLHATTRQFYHKNERYNKKDEDSLTLYKGNFHRHSLEISLPSEDMWKQFNSCFDRMHQVDTTCW